MPKQIKSGVNINSISCKLLEKNEWNSLIKLEY